MNGINGKIYSYDYDGPTNHCARPVVALPRTTEVTKDGDVWKVTNTVNDSNNNESVTLAEVTNDNIGDYIDLGNNIIKSSSTSDDWRILYVENDTVYAILSDYLPAEKVPSAAGLETDPTNFPYGVWLDDVGYSLLNSLSNTTAWNSFANEITGATATGAPTIELLIKSYNIKNDDNLIYDYANFPSEFDSNVEDFALYVPDTTSIDYFIGYWTATQYTNIPYYVFHLDYEGSFGIGNSFGGEYDYAAYGVRPIITLPSSTSVEIIDGVWTIIK